MLFCFYDAADSSVIGKYNKEKAAGKSPLRAPSCRFLSSK